LILNDLQDRIALHTWTIDTTPLAGALRVARDAGYGGIETRYADFKRCFDAGMTNARVLDLIRASGIKVAVMGTEYGVIFAKGEEQKRLLDSLDLMCSNAAALGCGYIMVAPGQNPPGTVKEAAASFRRCGEIAQQHGVRIALEFNSRHPVINRLEVAREILAAADHPHCGLLLDAYHLQCSGAGGRSFEDVPARDIAVFQYSDVPAGPVSGGNRPTDRLPPGKGVVRWNEVFQVLMEKDYRGWLSYEAPNPAQWSRPPEEVAREGLAATRTLLAAAEASFFKSKKN
jgi:sugar phosphate isomerase/epimerase